MCCWTACHWATGGAGKACVDQPGFDMLAKTVADVVCAFEVSPC